MYGDVFLEVCLNARGVGWGVGVGLGLGMWMWMWKVMLMGCRNKHIQVDFGTGNNNKINFEIGEKQDLVDILEVAYKAASKGKGLAVSPKGKFDGQFDIGR